MPAVIGSDDFTRVSSLFVDGARAQFSSVGEMLAAWRPREPVYCIHPHTYLETARDFLNGFPGRVLYAVKANDHPAVIRLINQAGIEHYDCASVPEIEQVKTICPEATCYFMVPVSLRGAAGEAHAKFGVRHFMIDHPSGLESLANEISFDGCVVFTRMAVSHESAAMDLSSKFGAAPDQVPALMSRIRDLGAEPALAFNTGTLVTQPVAYRRAIEVAAKVLGSLPFRVRLIDIGGGFAKPYPGYPAPPMEEYFRAVAEAASLIPMQENGELLAEPGRALAATGLSAVVEVRLRKENRLYLNDGMYGIFWELRFEAHKRFPARAFRDGKRLNGESSPFRLYGPTCDASDVLPGEVDLPADICVGDYIEFSHIGAYSLSGRTRFNGHYSERIIQIVPTNTADD